MTKNVDIDKYKYSGYGIGIDRHGCFWHYSGGTGRNLIIFEIDMSLSTKVDHRKKRIFQFLVKVLNKDYNRYYLQKKCIQLILLKIITNSAWACIIMEQRIIYLLTL